MKKAIMLVAAMAALSTMAIAQGMSPGTHSGHATPPAAADTPATRDYRAANAHMHRQMDMAYKQDADADFVRAMIPHHQGAIDMAKVALEYGKDEQVKKWAADILREQEREIAEMRAWLSKRGM